MGDYFTVHRRSDQDVFNNESFFSGEIINELANFAKSVKHSILVHCSKLLLLKFEFGYAAFEKFKLITRVVK